MAEGIAPVSLYKRKAENDDPEAEDKAQLEIINVRSIHLVGSSIIDQFLFYPYLGFHHTTGGEICEEESRFCPQHGGKEQHNR